MQNQTLLEGYILQEYQIIKVLGQGDFGITYLAWDINLHKNIVIKEFFIKGEVSREPNTSKVLLNSSISKKSYSYFLDKFISEARILASINHPNIVKVTRFFKANNTGYFVMDYMEGKTLESYIRNRGSLDEKTILRIIEPILNGLSVVHSKNFLHRDIAPDNIYLTKNGIPMLIDFGAVKNIIANESKSIAGVFKVGYSPTEQYFLGGEHTKATDIYSLGAVIAYMILGKRPIEASQRDYLEEDPLKKDLYAYKNIYSLYFINTVLKAMSIKAKDRYQTIAEFRKDLLSHTVTINLNKQTISNQCPFVIKELNTHQIDTNTTREKEGDWNRCYKYWIYIDKKGKPNFVKVVYLDNHSVNSIDLDELANQITEEERIFYKLENYFIAGAIREIDVLSKLDHKNIIKIKNMYEYNNHLHIYYDVDISENFRTLEEYINQNIEYSEESIIDFALTMLNTLKYMHNKNIIHNNIHPKNILIIDNQPILFNFQYSLLKNEKENIPDDGEDRIISGENIIYNSIFTFLSEKFSFFSNYYRDIYSLGIILYILLTNNKNINLAVDRIYKKGYYLNFPKYLNKKYSKTLIYAIKIATSVNPKDGFQSAQEMIDFIENKKTINRFNPFDWIKMK